MTQIEQTNKCYHINQQDDQINTIIEEKINKGNGEIFVKKYQKGKILGKGGFAYCYQVINLQTKKLSAIKIINKTTLKRSKAKQKLITQIKIHKLLNHKHIVMFDHVFQDSQNVYIILQLCNYHTLNEMIKKRKRISQLEVQYYLYQIVQGISYIHSSKIIHRDLKLGNLMISENMEIKIGDFGLAAKLEYSNQKRKTICGTPNYIAPQILQGKGHSYQVDIWSLGVIMYTLLYGKPPFQTNDVKKTYKRIKQCQYTFNDQINITNNAKNLISKVLVADPSKRLTLEQILNHPFMTSNKIPKVMPSFVLNTQLPKSFCQQYILQNNSTKLIASSKSMQKTDCQSQKVKSLKGISQRLLLRSSVGFNRNFFAKPQSRDDNQDFYNKPNALANNFVISRPISSNNHKKQISVPGNYIFVKKWVDYSSKYGLGYLLSDGATGIYFNDSSKIILDASNQKIDYLGQIQGQSKKLYSFLIDQIPESRQLSKKITLMQYFRKYLNSSSIINTLPQKKSTDPPFIYVKRWYKNQYGIIFRLNNKILQINFTDKSQIIIYTQKQLLIYTNSINGIKLTYQINNVIQIKKNYQLSQKIQKLKNMLKKLNQDQQNICINSLNNKQCLIINR